MLETEESNIDEVILVIEDNDGDYFLVEDYILDTFKRVSVVHCKSLIDSIACLENYKDNISVILLDLNLPDANGTDLVEKIVQSAQQIPIVILSGYTDLQTAKSSLQLGISDYLVKDEMTAEILQKAIIYAKERSYHINLIQKSKSVYQDLFDFSPEPMWIYNPSNLLFLNVNKAACSKYGYSLEEFQKMTIEDILPQEELEPLFGSLKGGKGNVGTSFDGTFLHKLKSKKVIQVEVFSSEVKFQDIKARLVLVHDVTEKLKYINTIEIQNKKLREIAWTQSHIVRAPLARIMGIIELISDKDNNTNDFTFWLSQLKSSSLELDDVIREIVGNTDILDPDNTEG